MTDLNHTWGNDIGLSPNGDLSVSNGDTFSQQELIRLLMTNPRMTDTNGNPFASPDYTWHSGYGVGLPRSIGRVANVAQIRGAILFGLGEIAGIASNPAPIVSVKPFNNGVSVSIRYQSSLTGQTSFLSFDINQ